MPSKKQAAEAEAGPRVVATTLASSIEERLRRDLISAVFMPVKSWPSIRFEKYGAGASPVREALNRLSAEGWSRAVGSARLSRSNGVGGSTGGTDPHALPAQRRSRCVKPLPSDRRQRCRDRWSRCIGCRAHRRAIPTIRSRSIRTGRQGTAPFHASLVAACSSRQLIDFDATLFEQAARYRALSARSRSAVMCRRSTRPSPMPSLPCIWRGRSGWPMRISSHLGASSPRVTRRHETA